MRLIDADVLYEAFKNGPSDTQEEKDFNQVGRYLVRHAPTVDVSVSGEWVGKHKSTCSLCGYISAEAYLGRAYFCANCGAKMERQNES